MDFKQILQKLKYSKKFNYSSLLKEIIEEIRHVDKADLLYMLDLLYNTSDMEYQAKLISVLSAYVLYNNLYRDVVIKSTSLYDTLNTILGRGLPRKTAITLNFITSLLYAEDDGGSRSRTLTLHAQNIIRSSGCLTTMSYLFMNYMLHNETWEALCRCIAEVCRGSEPNQNYCSHMVPLCVQRCSQGNHDVILILQSLLFNHKRNTSVFMQAGGASIFNRKDFLRLEAGLQLVHVVIQNAEVDAIKTISNIVQVPLRDSLKMNTGNPNLAQWATIVLYYLDLKLKGIQKCCNSTTNTKVNKNKMLTDSNVNDTQILMKNIMSEFFSYPFETQAHIRLKHSDEMPRKSTDIPNIAFNEDIQLHHNKRKNLENKQPRPHISNIIDDEKLSFSFLMEENLKYESTDPNTRNIDQNQTVQDTTHCTQSRISHDYEYSKFCDMFKTLNNESENLCDFKPTFVSTPKRSIPHCNKPMQLQQHSNTIRSVSRKPSTARSFVGLNNKRLIRNRQIIKTQPKKNSTNEKLNIKHKSMSSRLFEAINESCTTVLRSVRNVFTGSKSSIAPKDVTDLQLIKNNEQGSYCSYSFTKFMHAREAGLMEQESVQDVSVLNTSNTVNICDTCDDTLLLKHKFATDEQLKSTVKKLKLGINLYGCDFKRISKTMWPRETYMTPNVLYNLYRKLLVK